MSTRAALDRSVASFLRVAESGLIVVGDAQFDVTTKGQAASKHELWLRTLLRHVEEKRKRLERNGIVRDLDQPWLVPRGLFWVVGAEEYNTSQKCPRCFGPAEVYTTPPGRDGTPRQRIQRLKTCTTCRKVFHRDGMAATSLVTIGVEAFLHNTRPAAFCHPDWIRQSTGRPPLP